MTPGTVIVVQSGYLAAWVGAISGLAGVVLGVAGLDGALPMLITGFIRG